MCSITNQQTGPGLWRYEYDHHTHACIDRHGVHPSVTNIQYKLWWDERVLVSTTCMYSTAGWCDLPPWYSIGIGVYVLWKDTVYLIFMLEKWLFCYCMISWLHICHLTSPWHHHGMLITKITCVHRIAYLYPNLSDTCNTELFWLCKVVSWNEVLAV